ncbi:MAG: division/cell wall cluster transcriptional repressor MraZ [Actinobacteria bacterium]|nr:division/cell wall cluster transcriptional repressor MraZ [Actinomycetota bacterium]
MARRLGGTFFPKLDDKGRLTLPAKFREHFANGVVVTRVQEGCLAVYDVETFDSLDAKFEAKTANDAEIRAYQRWLNSGSHDDVPDRQGRVTLPAPLRTFAGLDRDVVVIGSGDRVEVWDPARWEKQSARLDEMFTT